MAHHISFSNFTEFEQYASQNSSQTLVVYKSQVCDVTEFLGDHPGGPAFITDFKNKDITEVFHDEDSHEHGESALKILLNYKIGSISASNTKEEVEESYPRITKDKIEYNDFTIDRTRGMVPQVFGLTKKQYMHMIHNSVHLPYCRLFDGDLSEALSRNPWYRIPMLWLPIAIYLIYQGLTFDYPQHHALDDYIWTGSSSFSIIAVLLTFFFGVFLWTLAEYGLHRGVFHFDDPLPDHPLALYLHFIIHGIHHTIPMDADRLVFPPVLGMGVYCLLFPLIVWVFPGNFGRIFAVGFILGYVCYDMTHIYIHHCTPFVEHLKEMKKYHNKHHYIDGNMGYGITSKLWDKVFGTELK